MKNFLRILLISLTIFMFNNIVNAQSSTCTSPYTSTNITVTYSSCSITFNVCLNCAPTGHPEVIFNYAVFDADTSSPCYGMSISATDWVEIKKLVIAQILLDCNVTIPPCENQSRALADYYEAACLEALYDGVNEQIILLPCDEEPGTCRIEFEACFNGTDIEVTKKTGPTLINSGNCDPGTLILNPNLIPDGCFSYCN